MKELYIFFIILFLLSFSLHFEEFIANPILHILSLKNAGVYGLGFFHPIVFTGVIYLIILIPRVIYKIFKRN